MAALWSPTPQRPTARSSLASSPPQLQPPLILGSIAAADAIREVRGRGARHAERVACAAAVPLLCAFAVRCITADAGDPARS
jgi:hypothetical protein